MAVATDEGTVRMTLTVDLTHRQGDFALSVAFDAPTGVTALFGRSGAGKTSVVKAVAGLVRPDRGRIVVGDQVLLDTAKGIDVPVHKRRIGYVFQDARLFPHMDVARNLTYGGRHDFDRIVDMLGLRPLLTRKPATLSGGEQSRVALGRALMSDPRILLMDEPLAALDQPRKAEILPYLERLRDEAGMPILYVSHDLSEVARLATSLVVMKDGGVVRAGPVSEVLSDPSMVATLGVREAGAVIAGHVQDYDEGDDLTTMGFDGGTLILPGMQGPTGAALRVRIAASDIILSAEFPASVSALNVLPVTVTDIQAGRGPGVAVGLLAGQTRLLARVTRRSATQMGLAEGKALFAIVKANAVAPQDIGH